MRFLRALITPIAAFSVGLVGTHAILAQAPAPVPVAEPAQQTPAAPNAAAAATPIPATSAVKEAPGATGDGIFSIELSYWLARQAPALRPGLGGDSSESFNFPGKGNGAPAFMVSIPLGSTATLRVSAFEAKGRGDVLTDRSPFIYDTQFIPGDYLVTRYSLRNVKISWDDLFLPYPGHGKRLRIKTLWELQYTRLKNSVDAPLASFVDESGNLNLFTTAISKTVFLPAVGMGMEYSASRFLRFQINASGMAIPHRSNLWDADAALAIRAKSFELLAGAKAFHVRTSPEKDPYLRQTLKGAYVAVRYYLGEVHR